MAHSKFSLDGPAFEDSTRRVIQPHHVMLLQEEAGVDNQLQIPPGWPGPREEQGEPAAVAPENSVLKCIMGDACNPLHEFREYEHYSFGDNSGSDCEVPEEELTDEMEDILSDEDQLVPVSSQEEEGPTEGDHGQQSPGNIPVDDTTAIEENTESSVANLHVTLVNDQEPEPEDPSTPRHLDEMEPIVAIEEDQLVPVNSHFTEGNHDQLSPLIIPVEDELIHVNLQEEEDLTARGDHDQTGHRGNIPPEDLTAVEEDGLIPVDLHEEEDLTVEKDHDQPSPVITPVDAVEGNETGPENLHLTPVSVQGTELQDPSTPRRLVFINATFDSAYPEADPGAGQVIPENQVDVNVQTVATTSAAEGESSSSN